MHVSAAGRAPPSMSRPLGRSPQTKVDPTRESYSCLPIYAGQAYTTPAATGDRRPHRLHAPRRPSPKPQGVLHLHPSQPEAVTACRSRGIVGSPATWLPSSDILDKLDVHRPCPGGRQAGRPPRPPMPRAPHPGIHVVYSIMLRVQLLQNSNSQFPYPRSRVVRRDCKPRSQRRRLSFRLPRLLPQYCAGPRLPRSAAHRRPMGDGRPQARRNSRGSTGSLDQQA